MAFPSFTFWLCLCMPSSLLFTLWEINKNYGQKGTGGYLDMAKNMLNVYWGEPPNMLDLKDVNSLLFAVYTGYIIILAMCYWVIRNIREINREMEKTIHDTNVELAATGLLQPDDRLQLEDRTLQVVQKQRDTTELLENETRRIRKELETSECKVTDLEKVISKIMREWEAEHGESQFEQGGDSLSVLSDAKELPTEQGAGESLNNFRLKMAAALNIKR